MTIDRTEKRQIVGPKARRRTGRGAWRSAKTGKFVVSGTSKTFGSSGPTISAANQRAVEAAEDAVLALDRVIAARGGESRRSEVRAIA